MRFPWNLIDRLICLHCWAYSRYDDPNLGRDGIWRSLWVARNCVDNRRETVVTTDLDTTEPTGGAQ